MNSESQKNFKYTLQNFIDVPVIYADFGHFTQHERYYTQDIIFACKKDESEFNHEKAKWDTIGNFLGVSTLDLSYDGSYLDNELQNLYNCAHSHRNSYFKKTKNILVSL